MLADSVIPNEYGIDPDGKLKIGSKICTVLLGKILSDLQNMREESLVTAVSILHCLHPFSSFCASLSAILLLAIVKAFLQRCICRNAPFNDSSTFQDGQALRPFALSSQSLNCKYFQTSLNGLPLFCGVSYLKMSLCTGYGEQQ